MLDNCTLRLSNVDWETLKSNPSITWLRQEVLRTQHTIRYLGKMPSIYDKCSLYIRYNPDTRMLTIKNSLHKWYKGSNSGRFTLTEVEDAVCILSVLLEVDLWQAIVTQFEFGVNLPTDEHPYYYLKDILVYGGQGKILYDTSYKGHCISRTTENYYFKLYDKTMEARLDDNVLRIEVRRMDARRYLPALQTVEQVVCEQGFAKLSKELIRMYSCLQFDDEQVVADETLSINDVFSVMLLNRVVIGHIRSSLERNGKSSKSIARAMKKLDLLKNKCKIVSNPKKAYLSLWLKKELAMLTCD